MRLHSSHTPWSETYAALEAGEQVLRVVQVDDPSKPLPEPTKALLLDRDVDRLQDTGRRYGVRLAERKVRSRGDPNQHIELWGRPLARLHLSARWLNFTANA